jgi:hypothetical protein
MCFKHPSNAIKVFRSFYIGSFFLFFLSCAQSTGITIKGSVKDEAVSTSVRKGREILLAVWFQEPKEGLRPKAVVTLADVLVTRGTGKVNEFLWETPLDPEKDTPIYVGAFLESPSFKNSLPDPGEYLGYTGPLSLSQLTDVTIVLGVDTRREKQILIEDFFNRMEEILNRKDGLTGFVQAIHPFYFDSLARNIENLPLWLDGSYPALSTLYTSPVSAPQWGWFSQEIRDRFELRNFRIQKLTDSFGEGGDYTARILLTYEFKLGVVQTVEETMKLYLSEIDRVFYLRRIEPIAQSFQNIVSLGTQEFIPEANPQITLSWSPPIVGTLILEEYNPATGLFSPITSPVPLDGSFNQVSVGPNVSLVTGAIRAPLTSIGYYRFRISPMDNPDLYAVFYSRGENYPY